ncbi:unnamed protein product [Cochlearia groenlandica]
MILTKATTILIFFVSVSLTLTQSNNGGHVSILISETGLDFAKNYLINEVISTTIPLKLPEIEKKAEIPLIGKVRMGLTNIQILAIEIKSSSIMTGQDGIFMSVSGTTSDLVMDWSYAYKASFFKISDHGNASVKVNGIDVKVSVNLVDDNGNLKIASRGSDCKVKSIDIHINGGASWLYQGVVDAFEKKIMSTVEENLSSKIMEKMKKLDTLLQSIPKERKIDENVAVNLTFTGSPLLSDSSIEVGINGLFTPNGDSANVSGQRLLSYVRGIKRMVTVSLQEEVFGSATLVYFNAKWMRMVIDESKNGSTRSTLDWKNIFPELYKHYPDVKMMLNMSVTSPPDVSITENGIGAEIQLEISIGVQDSTRVLSVARISSVLNVACSAEVAENNLAGSLELVDFNATMKWSRIGELQANFVKDVTSKILEALFLPNVNTRLKRGFPLPFPHGLAIKNTEIVFVENRIMVCSDIASYQI